MQYNQYILPNGLKIIHESSPTNVVYCGFIINAGTRDEDKSDYGLAHFCEHNTFKGTNCRKAWQIRNALESVGGDLNAYTNKQETVYYATVQKKDFRRAVDILSDLVFHSIYPQQELEKEREVVIDEIDCYNDSPAELIYDEFEEMIFKGHGLGRNILGNATRLREYTSNDLKRFTNRYYTTSNSTFFVYGQVDFNYTIRLLERMTEDATIGEQNKITESLPPYIPEEKILNKDTHQAHVLIGARGFGSIDSRKTALFLLNNILGGPGMNSLLNVSLREKHGLVYTTESSSFSYTDTGMWSVYYGCDENDIDKCRRLVLHELHKLCEEPLSFVRLNKAKKQLIGQILIASDNFESYALAMGKTFAHIGKHRDVNEICEKICSLSAQDLQDVAQSVFAPSNLTTLIYT